MTEKTTGETQVQCRRWLLCTLGLALTLLILAAAVTIYIDPLFHYHAPVDGFQYPIIDERYMNNGIARHFDYDSILTGSSLSENCRTSWAEELFGGKFIKMTYAGSMLKEIRDNVERAFATGHKIDRVFFDLRYKRLIADKDAYVDYQFPDYLYDNNPFNDVSYVLNKSVLLRRTLEIPFYTREGHITTPFDECYSWFNDAVFGRDEVFTQCPPVKPCGVIHELTEKEQQMVRESVRQNIVDVANAHPDTTFYIYFAPVSICFWEGLWAEGRMEAIIQAERIAVELMLECPNIELYSFTDSFDIVCDLDNYKDAYHYHIRINDWIYECLAKGEHKLTKENYPQYLKQIQDFYLNYDYEALRD